MLEVARRVGRATEVCVFLACVTASPGFAQERDDAAVPALRLDWMDLSFAPPETEEEVDHEERLAGIQREFERRGLGAGGFGEDELARIGEQLVERFEGSAVVRWYERAVDLYERLEGFYEGVDALTEWAASGFDVSAEIESVIDGTMELHVEREVLGLDLGLDVADAAEGRFGLRLAGVVWGYRLGLGAGDLTFDDLSTGRLKLRISKRFD